MSTDTPPIIRVRHLSYLQVEGNPRRAVRVVGMTVPPSMIPSPSWQHVWLDASFSTLPSASSSSIALAVDMLEYHTGTLQGMTTSYTLCPIKDAVPCFETPYPTITLQTPVISHHHAARLSFSSSKTIPSSSPIFIPFLQVPHVVSHPPYIAIAIDTETEDVEMVTPLTESLIEEGRSTDEYESTTMDQNSPILKRRHFPRAAKTNSVPLRVLPLIAEKNAADENGEDTVCTPSSIIKFISPTPFPFIVGASGTSPMIYSAKQLEIVSYLLRIDRARTLHEDPTLHTIEQYCRLCDAILVCLSIAPHSLPTKLWVPTYLLLANASWKTQFRTYYAAHPNEGLHANWTTETHTHTNVF